MRVDATNGTDHGGTTYALKTLQMQQAIQAQSTERAGYKPDLSIVGFLGANHYSDTFDPWKGSKWFPTSFIGLNLTVPLTEGFIRQQRVQRLDFLIAAADLDREAALRQRDLEFERAEIARQSAAAAMQAQDAIVQLAIQKWNITVARAAQERATQTEVMAALNDLQLAQTQQLRRKYAWLLADLEIRRLCGLLDF
jgi:outer membrane protein TolC